METCGHRIEQQGWHYRVLDDGSNNNDHPLLVVGNCVQDFSERKRIPAEIAAYSLLKYLNRASRRKISITLRTLLAGSYASYGRRKEQPQHGWHRASTLYEPYREGEMHFKVIR